MIQLSVLDLLVAAVLVLLLAYLTWRNGLGLSQSLLVSATRTAAQLSLVGLVLKALFADGNLHWVVLMAVVMLLVAGREVMARQQHRLRGGWGFSVGTLSMFLSSFTVTLFALLVIIRNEPWYAPQYAIPLLGMLLGNTMNGVALSVDRLTQTAWDQRETIEAQLMLGLRWQEAMLELRRQANRAGLTPIINAMAAAGVVSLPGMMTGQILAGAPPWEAVKYQILIMFLIAAGSGLGTLAAVSIASRRLFDERERLRLDRLHPGRP
jgi:putative ABC transport system permease protein